MPKSLDSALSSIASKDRKKKEKPASNTSKKNEKSAVELPTGVGIVPKWWMDCTPHDTLDVEGARQRQIEAQWTVYFQNLEEDDVDDITLNGSILPARGPSSSLSQNHRQRNVKVNPKAFGIPKTDPNYRAYKYGQKVPPVFLSKMRDKLNGTVDEMANNRQQTEQFSKYNPEKASNQPAWATMKLRQTSQGQKIRGKEVIDMPSSSYTRRVEQAVDPATYVPAPGKKLVRKTRMVKKNSKGKIMGHFQDDGSYSEGAPPEFSSAVSVSSREHKPRSRKTELSASLSSRESLPPRPPPSKSPSSAFQSAASYSNHTPLHQNLRSTSGHLTNSGHGTVRSTSRHQSTSGRNLRSASTHSGDASIDSLDNLGVFEDGDNDFQTDEEEQTTYQQKYNAQDGGYDQEQYDQGGYDDNQYDQQGGYDDQYFQQEGAYDEQYDQQGEYDDQYEGYDNNNYEGYDQGYDDGYGGQGEYYENNGDQGEYYDSNGYQDQGEYYEGNENYDEQYQEGYGDQAGYYDDQGQYNQGYDDPAQYGNDAAYDNQYDEEVVEEEYVQDEEYYSDEYVEETFVEDEKEVNEDYEEYDEEDYEYEEETVGTYEAEEKVNDLQALLAAKQAELQQLQRQTAQPYPYGNMHGGRVNV